MTTLTDRLEIRRDDGPLVTPAGVLEVAQAAYDGAVRNPTGQHGLEELVSRARHEGAAEALVVALRARAWCARHAHALDEARSLLDEAAGVASRHHLTARLVEVLSTRAAVNLELGRGRAARRDLDRARELAGPAGSADLTLQRAVLDHNEGRLPSAAVLYAALLADPLTPPTIAVKAANNLALIESGRGDFAAATARLEQVLPVAEQLGPALLAIVEDSLGWTTVQSGRLVAGLRLLDSAAARHRAADLPLGEHYLEHSDALEDLRLLPEARAMARRARDEFARHGVRLLSAEAQVRVARLALLAGDPGSAEVAAADARALFRQQRRSAWAAYALVLEVRARRRLGMLQPTDLAAVRRAAQTLDRGGQLSWASDAYLVAAETARSIGRRDVQRSTLAAAERLTADGPALQRLRGHVAGARRATLDGDRAAVLRHTRAGLVDLAEHRDALPSAELRALAAGHGVELGRLALRELLRHGSATEVLQAMERSRAVSLLSAGEAELAPDDPLLAELRAVHGELAMARAESGHEPPELLATQRSLEHRIRRATWLGTSDAVGHRHVAPGPAELRAVLGERTLVEYASVDGEVVAVVVAPRRTRLVRLGRLDLVEAESRHLLLAVRRLSLGRTSPAAAAALWAGADEAAGRLRSVLVEPLRLPPGVPAVIVPASPTWRLPWSHLVPEPVSVSPSAATWLRAASRPAPTDHRVVLVAGPDLPGAAREVQALAALHPGARSFGPSESRVDAVLPHLAGAGLAHLACHGRMRADNPTFSSFALAAGELTVHELQQRGVAPYRVLLSACDSGADTALAGDELVGFVTALLAQGTAGLLASCVQVSDAETVPLMDAVHRRLLAGRSLAEALHDAVAEGVEHDRPESLAVRCAFNAYGAV